MNYGRLRNIPTYNKPEFMESKEFIKLWRDAGFVYSYACGSTLPDRYPNLCFRRKVGSSTRITYFRKEAIRYIELKKNTNSNYKSFDVLVKSTVPHNITVGIWRSRILNKIQSGLRIKIYKFYGLCYLQTKDYERVLVELNDYINESNK